MGEGEGRDRLVADLERQYSALPKSPAGNLMPEDAVEVDALRLVVAEFRSLQAALESRVLRSACVPAKSVELSLHCQH
jgi:hypothetical protein